MKLVIFYWHTLRHLTFQQTVGRVWFLIKRHTLRIGPAPKLITLRQRIQQWHLSPRSPTSMFGPTTYHFLNETSDIGTTGWNASGHSALWQYNLHYFNDLISDSASQRLSWHNEAIHSWIRENKVGAKIAWDPYPTSLRIVNWVKWHFETGQLSDRSQCSLYMQARWLSKTLEHHLGGNHLFSNAKALYFTGAFFDGEEAQQWLDTSLKIISEQIRIQILEDGGHYEKTPMYHGLFIVDLLDLINITEAYDFKFEKLTSVVEQWKSLYLKMYRWLMLMCHPDGEISFFNDSAFAISPKISEIEIYAAVLGLSAGKQNLEAIEELSGSGYLRLSSENAVAIVDVGTIGPKSLPGHAHADTLSFELSINERRVIVNSGTSCYGLSFERQRQRSTNAHNTVTVNDDNSSEVWRGFRVARRAYPVDLRVLTASTGVQVQCSHNGYRRLRGRPTHRRLWTLEAGGLAIIDEVLGQHDVAIANYHFHPDLSLTIDDIKVSGVGSICGTEIFRWQVVSGDAHITQSTWHPEFGLSEPNQKLVLALRGGKAEVRFSWT